MALKYRGSNGTFWKLALALPLAVLVVPVGSIDLGKAEAVTVKKAKKRKVVVTRKPVTTKKVCTVTRVKGRKVTKCKTVKLTGAPHFKALSIDTAAPSQPPPAASLAVQPVPLPPPVLQPAPTPRINPADYYWIDQADSLAQAFGNSPPDFTFSCDGIDCWAWVSRDGEILIVEPGRYGVQQFFFAPRQTSPYLVRDSYNAFAFDARELIVIYDNQGRVMPYGADPRQRDLADALRERGRALYAASLRQRRWDRGDATAWIGGHSSLGYDDGWNYGWNPFWRELPDWDRYDRDRHRNRPPRHLDEEHRDRDDARRRYDDWHRRGAEGAPPPTGNPVVTPTEDGGTPPAPRPPRPPRPAPTPTPAPAPTPQPGWQPQPQPATYAPPPPPQGGNPPPRSGGPRLEIEPEPGAPPIPVRPVRPRPQPVETPVTQIEAQSDPAPVPVPPPAPAAQPSVWPDPMPDPMNPPPPPTMQAPAPAPEPIRQYQAPPPPPPPAPVAAPVPVPVPVPVPPPPPPPPPPPSPPPPRDEIRTEIPSDGTDRP